MRLYSELAGWFHLLTAPEDYEEEAAEIVTARRGCGRGGAEHAAGARLRRRQQREPPQAPLRVHAHRRLGGDARGLAGAEPRVRAPRRRHADAPARAHIRRRARPRRDRLHDERGRPAGRRSRRRSRTRARAASRSSIPDCTRETLVERDPSRRPRRRRPLAPLPGVDARPGSRRRDVRGRLRRRAPRGRRCRSVSSTTATSRACSRRDDWLRWLQEAGFQASAHPLAAEEDWTAFVARRPS